jgi:glycosyltransferase involved in cell wall biosynthesis
MHAHFGVDATYALPLARRLGVPLVVTLHGFDVSMSTTAMLKSANYSWWQYVLHKRELAAGAAAFLCVSEHVRKLAMAAGFPDDKLATMHLGVDTARLAKISRVGGAKKDTIVHVGRQVEKKGTLSLIRAFSEIAPRWPAARLILVGDGPLRPSLEAEAAMTGHSDRIEFLGMRPHHEVLEIVSGATVFCLPSVTARSGDTEGLPVVLMEAAALGIPIVATRHAGIPELVIDGDAGLLVPERDAGSLARSLNYLLGDEAARRRFGQAAQARARSLFDTPTNAAAIEKVYDRVIDQGLSGGARV